MRRIAYALMILMLLSPAVSAQGFSLGVKGGLFTANTTGVPLGLNNTSFKNGFAGGVSLGYAFNDYFSLQPEVLYVMKGLDGVVSNRFAAAKFTGAYDYVEMPILAKLTLAAKSRVSPYVFFGPSLGINVKADIQIEWAASRFDEASTETRDYSSVTNSMEVCLVFGAGLNVAVGRGAITLDGRFDLGLSNVTKGGDLSTRVGDVERIETVPASTSKNIGFALLAGYAF